MSRKYLRLAALTVCVAALTTACAKGNATTPTAGSSTTAAVAADGTKTAAADLRGALTGLLEDHVYLAGIAINTVVANKGDLTTASSKAAVAALDANSVSLSKALGSVYPDAEKPFLASWRQHIGFFVNYTFGLVTKDAAKTAKAKADLDGYRTSFGQLIHSVVPELPADAVAQELIPHVATILTAIDDVVAGNPNVFADLQTAAAHMPMTAKILASGIASNKMLDGAAGGGASDLRGALTGLLEDHVYLAGIAVNTVVANKGDLTTASSKAALAALDANSVSLSKALGSVYPEIEKPFLASWRQHLGFFVNYTFGLVTKDAAKTAKAKADLDGYRTSFGQLIHSVVPELPADAVAQEFIPHVATVLTAIDDVVAGSPNVFADLQTAAAHMPMTAAILASGIATNKKIA